MLRYLAAMCVASAAARGSADETAIASPEVRGGIMPLEKTSIRVKSERVTIDLANPDRVHVRAEYVLANRGPPRSVRLGVPTAWRRHEFLDNLGEPPEEIIEGAKLIRIVLAGRSVECLPQPAENPGPRDVEVWCVARPRIPTGEDFVLTLDSWGSAVRIGHPSERAYRARAIFQRTGAGAWLGPVDDVVVEIDPGRYAAKTRVIAPAGFTQADGKLRWQAKEVDPQRLDTIIVEYREHPDVPGNWVRVNAALEASASTTLPPQGAHAYTPDRAVDRNRSTAWCEGAPGDGVGEWLAVKVTAPDSHERECRILDVEIVPGLASSEAVYRANGRLLAGRLHPCDDDRGFSFVLDANAHDQNVWPRLAEIDHAAYSAAEVMLPPGQQSPVPTCVKLVVTGVRRGVRYHDTCIGEFIPRVYCRTKPDP